MSKITKDSSSSDDSDDDDEISTAALIEACDTKFLPQSLFSNDKDSLTTTAEIEEPKLETKPSLRITERCDNFESFRASRSFKDYVAKKLDDLLTRNIQVDVESNRAGDLPKKKRARSDIGIKLLSTSEETLVAADKTERDIGPKPRTNMPSLSREDEADRLARCKQVAVDSDWILSKIETDSWSERQKGGVFEYKKNSNGVLIEQQ